MSNLKFNCFPNKIIECVSIYFVYKIVIIKINDGNQMYLHTIFKKNYKTFFLFHLLYSKKIEVDLKLAI